MRVSLEWLSDYVLIPDNRKEVAHKLTMAGIEVEGVERVGDKNRGLVVAKVVSAEPVEGKSLLLCGVEAGQGETSVICGDTTIRAGETVAYAPPGSLVGGRDIATRPVGGVESHGMLCSLEDLGLEQKSADVLRVKARPGQPLSEVIALDDEVWELNITPNRADCLSHWGVARELASVLGVKAKTPKPRVKETGADYGWPVRVEDTQGCPLYTARVVRGVKIGPSPVWVRVRLEKAGMRSVNNVVDATNLALLELGQPLHAFDLAKLDGAVVVRRASEGETISLIDGKQRKLTAADLVIADNSRPVALAGIMGGADTEVGDGTTDILLESAYFDPVSVRKSSKRHGLHTEASHRFERAVDPAMVETALDRCAQLMTKLAKGKVERGKGLHGPGVPAPALITLRMARVARILGVEISAAEAKRFLKSLGCDVKGGKHELAVVPPTWRPDLALEIDLIEEVARLYGFDRIPTATPTAPSGGIPPFEPDRVESSRRWMVDHGFQECVTYAFTAPDWSDVLGLADRRGEPIPVGNPLTVEQSVMRTTMLSTLLDAAALNWRRGNQALRLFDIGRVFLPAGDGHEEPNHLGGVVVGDWDTTIWSGGKGREADFFDVKGVVDGLLHSLGLSADYRRVDENFLHPGISAELIVGGKTAGWVGVLHPEVMRKLDIAASGLAFELDLGALPEAEKATIEPPSRFPSVLRDLAFLVDKQVLSGDVAAALRNAGPGELDRVELFDVYEGEALGARKNLAYHLRFQSPERTLTDEEIDAAVAAMVKAVEAEFQAELRAH